MKREKRILIFSGGGGHLSQAQALEGLFSQGGWVVRLVTPAKVNGFNLYQPFYLYFPSLFKLPFKMSHFKKLRKLVKEYGRTRLKLVEEGVNSFKPDVIFNTHFFCHYAVEKIIENNREIKFFNLVSDPRTIHPIIFSSRAINLTYDHRGVDLGKKYGFDGDRIVPVGWLVRKQFYQHWSRTKTRSQLGFDNRTFTLLICGGSGGANAILKIFPALLKVSKPLQVVVVAGKNTWLYKLAKPLEKLSHNSFYVWESRVKVKVFKFVKNMAPIIQAVDLVVGKAGPNLLFETIASGKPFFAISHIHGQEDGNLDLIRKKKLGWVEENGEKAGKLLLKIINQPKRIARLEKSIMREREHNKRAGERILKLVKESLR